VAQGAGRAGHGRLGLRTACVTKVFPTRSHTVAAQGGMAASLGNMGDGDNWRFHMYDTVKGSDWLGDQTRSSICAARQCGRAGAGTLRRAVLTHRHGKIYQRPSAGQPSAWQADGAAHLCDGRSHRHAILHAVPAVLKHNTEFFVEYFALDC